MSKRRLLLQLSCGIFSLLIIFGFQGNKISVAGAAGNPIIFGDDSDFTGLSSGSTDLQIAGMDLAIHQYGGQIAGRPIKSFHEDGAADQTMSVDKAKKLIEKDHADIMFGPIHAPEAIAVDAYMKSTGKPHIVMMMPRKYHSAKNSNVFTIHGTMSFDGYIMGKYTAEVLGFKTATAIHDDMVDGEDFVQGAMDGFAAAGGKTIQRQRTPLNTMDYAPYLSSLKKADVCFFWFIPPNAMTFLTNYKAYGVKTPLVMAGINVLGQPFLDQLKDNGVGIYAPVTNHQDVDVPAVKEWMKEWKALYAGNKKFSNPAWAEACNYYVMAEVACEALKQTNGNTDPKLLCDTIHKMKLKTPWGQLSFNEYGVPVGNVYITKTVKENGMYKLQVVKKYDQLVRDIPSSIVGKAPKM